MLLKILKKARLGCVSLKALAPFVRHFGHTVSMTEVEACSILSSHSPAPQGTAFSEGLLQEQTPGLDLDIIVPVYNAQPYLRDCIASILSQETHYRFRAIFIDDGSTDQSGPILDEYLADPRVLVLHQENQGPSSARNAGIARSGASYLLFQDADDLLAPGAVEQLLSAAYAHNAALVQGCFATFCGDKPPRRAMSFSAPVTVNPPLNMLPGYPWGKVIRRDCFCNLRFPQGYLYEDTICVQLLYPLLLRDGETIVGIDHIVCHYQENPRGISHMAQGKPKALDSFWITKALYADRPLFSLDNTQLDYEAALDMIVLTYERTQHLPEAVRMALMVQWRVFLQEQFPGFHTSRKPLKTLEEALKDENFPLYSLCCQLQ